MTKKEKLRILKGMKRKFAEWQEEGRAYYYLCWIWADFVYGDNDISDNYLKCPLKELGIEKPKKIFSEEYGIYWNPHDYTIRLRALNKAIRKLQPKKK